MILQILWWVAACSSNWSTFPLMKVLILFVFIAFLDAIIYLVCFGFIKLCLLYRNIIKMYENNTSAKPAWWPVLRKLVLFFIPKHNGIT